MCATKKHDRSSDLHAMARSHVSRDVPSTVGVRTRAKNHSRINRKTSRKARDGEERQRETERLGPSAGLPTSGFVPAFQDRELKGPPARLLSPRLRPAVQDRELKGLPVRSPPFGICLGSSRRGTQKSTCSVAPPSLRSRTSSDQSNPLTHPWATSSGAADLLAACMRVDWKSVWHYFLHTDWTFNECHFAMSQPRVRPSFIPLL